MCVLVPSVVTNGGDKGVLILTIILVVTLDLINGDHGALVDEFEKNDSEEGAEVREQQENPDVVRIIDI